MKVREKNQRNGVKSDQNNNKSKIEIGRFGQKKWSDPGRLIIQELPCMISAVDLGSFIYARETWETLALFSDRADVADVNKFWDCKSQLGDSACGVCMFCLWLSGSPPTVPKHARLIGDARLLRLTAVCVGSCPVTLIRIMQQRPVWMLVALTSPPDPYFRV